MTQFILVSIILTFSSSLFADAKEDTYNRKVKSFYNFAGSDIKTALKRTVAYKNGVPVKVNYLDGNINMVGGGKTTCCGTFQELSKSYPRSIIAKQLTGFLGTNWGAVKTRNVDTQVAIDEINNLRKQGKSDSNRKAEEYTYVVEPSVKVSGNVVVHRVAVHEYQGIADNKEKGRTIYANETTVNLNSLPKDAQKVANCVKKYQRDDGRSDVNRVMTSRVNMSPGEMCSDDRYSKDSKATKPSPASTAQ